MRFIRGMMYQLLKLYGSTMDFYSVDSVAENLETGEATIQRTVYPKVKVILFPFSVTRETFVTGGWRSFNENDFETRSIAYWHKLFPVTQVKEEDYFMINNQRYNIEKIDGIIDGQVSLIKIRRVKGMQNNALTQSDISESLATTEAVDNE